MENIDWIYQLKETVPGFLTRLKNPAVPGFFRYSLSGDLIDETKQWGLGNTVFAVKIFYTLNLLDTLPEQDRQDMEHFIRSFERADGTIADPTVRKMAFWKEKLIAVKTGDVQNCFHTQTERAETRQAVSALRLLGVKTGHYPVDLPKTKQEVTNFLKKLDWTRPWGAGSHFSHLLFFLANSELPNRDELIGQASEWLGKIQDPATGSWFTGSPSLSQKVNGAMKVLTGLKAANRMDIRHAERLIDLALSASNDRSACDNFNVVYVLKYAREAVGGTYREQEIKKFAEERLKIYREYYWPEIGGFSFYKGRANRTYYGARITQGLPEPDIHGTVMFLWGIALLTQTLQIEETVDFREFIT